MCILVDCGLMVYFAGWLTLVGCGACFVCLFGWCLCYLFAYSDVVWLLCFGVCGRFVGACALYLICLLYWWFVCCGVGVLFGFDCLFVFV